MGQDGVVANAGTGTIVAHSGSYLDTANRILTASHGVSPENLKNGARIVVMASNGRRRRKWNL
jgi:hypothetical protein